jgi:hypothetical protein
MLGSNVKGRTLSRLALPMEAFLRYGNKTGRNRRACRHEAHDSSKKEK